MATIQNVINGGIVKCGDELAARLTATPTWAVLGSVPTPAPEVPKAKAPARRGRRAAQKPAGEPDNRE